ncbi:Sugar transporter ERD6-like 5 [Camellia lanceoleosa]|uniref:Sugar transporter ERD6-like 5 n=1 Tax=Camellia lanceoleosa TaxID=1840588 RepID=A0ACC0I6E5_9ERIC|nr:Sugar transporter ERD6-like 5 [Camellia lanceoleosa]
MEEEVATTRSLLLAEEMADINDGGDAGGSSSSTTAVLLFGTFVAICGLFAYGCASGYSSPAESGIMEDLGLSTVEYSVFASVMTIGGMLGAIVSGKLTDLTGRRGAIWFSDIFITVGWLAILLAEGAWSLDLGRLSMGFGYGILPYAAHVYIAEITPKNIRGGFAAAGSIMVCGGLAFMFFVGNIFTWRTLAIFGMMPCLVQFLGLFFIPESPRWLAKIGRESELEDTIRRLRGKNVDIYAEVTEIREYTKTFQQLSKANILTLFERRYAHPLIICAAGTCLGNILVGLAFLFQDLHLPMELSTTLVLSGVMVYSACMSLGMNGIPWVILAEIFPINIRGSAGSFVTFVYWFSSWIVSYSFNFLFEWSSAGIFFVFATICGSTVLFVAKLVPETKGRSLEEIQASMIHL